MARLDRPRARHAEHVALAAGQALEARGRGRAGLAAPGARSHPAGDDAGDGRVEVDLAAMRGPDRRGQVVRLGILEQEAARAGLDRGRDALLLDEARDGDDLDGRVAGLELGRGGDPVETGHDEVHDDDVGEQRRRRLERRDAVGGLADDLEVIVQVEEVAHAAADHGMVVDDQDTDPGAHALAADRRRRSVGPPRSPGPYRS